MLIKSSRRPQLDSTRPLPPAAPVGEKSAPLETVDESTGPLAGDAGQRLGHFVRGVTHESLQHLRYLSVANAFQKVGSTVGSLALTPLAIRLAQDNAPLIGGLAIGGTVAAGAIGAAVGYAWLHHKDGKEQDEVKTFSKIHDTALTLGTAVASLPKFVYPSVVGATAAQTEMIYNALDTLPLHQATASATIEIVPDLLKTGISGMAQPGASHVHMLLDESYMSGSHGGHLVLHEQAHAVDYGGGFGLVGAHNWKSGFGKAPFVSNYASTNRYEDFAESFEAYNLDPEGFRAEFPEKAAALERLRETDPITGAMDTPRVRNAGREIGSALAKVPYLRTGLELAGSLVAPIQVHRGASKLIEGLESGDKEQQLDGKLNLATGLFLSLPGAQPLALATGIAGTAIRLTAKDENGQYVDQANQWADRVLTASAGPVGVTAAAVLGELKANGMRIDESTGFGPNGWSAARPGRATMLKGTLATVGGTVGGAILGAALGGMISGNTGAVMGALWGQVAGGMVGLGGYAALRTIKQDKKENDPLRLTADDRQFLRRTVGAAVVGGTAGTVAGALGGRAVGEAVGTALGGSGVGQLLGSVGGWTGALAAGYGGAKLGAAVGSGRLFGKGPEQTPQEDNAWVKTLQANT